MVTVSRRGSSLRPGLAGLAGLGVCALTAAISLILAPAAGASSGAAGTGSLSPGSLSTESISTGSLSSGSLSTGTPVANTGSGSLSGATSTTQVTVPLAGAPAGTSTATRSPSAISSSVDDVTPSSLTAPAGTGADSLLGPPQIRHGNPETFAERYGSSSYGLTEAPGIASTTPEDGALGAVTDAMWAIVTLLVGFAISVVEWAFKLDLAGVLAPALQHITAVLVKGIFDPWVTTVIVVGAAWLVWWGLIRRRASVAGEGGLWMLVALVAAIAFLAQPTSLLTAADHATSAIGSSTLSALAPVTPADKALAGASTPAGAYEKGPTSDAELRRTANTIWDTYVYEPWLVAEFGSVSAGSTAGPAWLALQGDGGTVQAEQAALAGAQPAGAQTGATQPAGVDTPAGTGQPAGTGRPAAGATASATAQAWFAGAYPAGRFGVVLVALAAAAALCALLVALALAVLLAQVALVLLVALAPVFLLLGVHPGQGRRVALRWAEMVVAALLKRVVYSVGLAVVLVVIGTLIALMSAAGVGWAMTTLLPTLALVALVVFRKRVIQALLGTGTALATRAAGTGGPRAAAPGVGPAAGPAPREAAPSRSRYAPAPGPGRAQRAPAGTGVPDVGARPPWWMATRHPSPVRGPGPAATRPPAGSPAAGAPSMEPDHEADRDPAPVG